MVRWLGGQWYPQPTRVQVPDWTLVLAFPCIYSRSSGDVRSVGRDVLVNYEGACDDFVNLKMLCRLSLSKVLIGGGCVCDHMCECMSACACIVLKRNAGRYTFVFASTPPHVPLHVLH